MPNDLATLETQRSKLLEEFLDLGALRQGSISAVTRRCGKPTCHSITPLDRHEVGKKVDEKVRSNGEAGKPSFKKRERQGTQIRGWKLRVQSRRCRQSAYSWRKATRGSTRVARRAGM